MTSCKDQQQDSETSSYEDAYAALLVAAANVQEAYQELMNAEQRIIALATQVPGKPS